MTPWLNEQGEDNRESPSQTSIGLVPTREVTPEPQYGGSFHLSQDSTMLDRCAQNELLLSALSRGDAFDDPEEFASTLDRPCSIPNLVITLCDAESNEYRQEDIDRDDRSNVSHDSGLLFATSGETERGESILGSALSCGSHLGAPSPLSVSGSAIEEAGRPHRKRKGKARAPDSAQVEQTSDSQSEEADDRDGDHVHDWDYSSDFSEAGSGGASDALAMGIPGPSRLNRLPARRAGARNCEDLSALAENCETSLEEQQRRLEHFSALKPKQQKEKLATNKRRRQPDSDDDEEADDPTFQPSPGAQRKLRNTPVKRVKTGAGALPDVDEGSTSSHRRPSREVTASYDSNEPSDASRPDAKKRNKGNNKNIDLDYTHKKRKQETSTFAPNKKRRTETSQESFPCPTCGKVIGRFFDLKRHMKTHKGDKFPCPVTGCSNVFSRQDAVVRHVKGKHKPKTSLRHRADENGDLETDEAQNTECDVDDDEEDDKEEAEARKAQKSCPKPKKGGKRKRK